MDEINSIDTIYFHLTKECNLNCEYCYFSAGKPMNKELSKNEIYSVLKNISFIKPRRLVFTGGEPLLRKNIFEFAKSCENENVHLCINTNGTLVTENNAKDLVKLFDEIRISIDGRKEINDKLRGRGCFEKAMKAFRYVLNAGGNPVALITVTTKTLPSLKDFMQFLFNNGIRRIHVNPLKNLGRAKYSLICNQEKIDKTVEDFWYETFGLKLKHNISENAINCGVGRYITINPDGSVYPCHALEIPEFCIGNVRKDRLHNIIQNSELMCKLRNFRFHAINNCGECCKDLLETDYLGIKAQYTRAASCFNR